MAQFRNKVSRAAKCATSIKPLGNGKWGARVVVGGKVIQQDNSARSRQQAAKNLKELLRWADKLGYDCPMASSSRMRQKKR